MTGGEPPDSKPREPSAGTPPLTPTGKTLTMELNRTGIDRIRDEAAQLGYRAVSETDQLHTTGRIILLLEGYGEEFRAHFKVRPNTGYLAWSHASAAGGRFIPSWNKLRKELDEVREYGLSDSRTPDDPANEEQTS